MHFFSIEELNREIQRLLVPYNDLLFQRKEASRRELFQSVERQYLKALPDQPYQIKQYARAKVQKIGYVYFSPDKTCYSVPFRYIGKNTQIHYTQTMVEVYFNHERIALHRRNPTPGAYITNKDHLSSTHKAYSDWSPEYFTEKAAKLGDNVKAFVQGLFAKNTYPETAYKRAMGIIQLSKLYGEKRLDNACLRAIYAGTYSYNRVKNILENKLDGEPLGTDGMDSTGSHIPPHDNLRGASEYQ